MTTTIFSKIIAKDVPAKIIFEDDLCLAFHDVNPQAPVHILVIPKITELDRLDMAKSTHQALLGHLLLKVSEIALAVGLSDYRVVINNGEGAGQSVFHLHLHLLGGREFAWPPG